jgi:signal transduction histidine kinase/ligand-binding sensor domain-containing protein
LTEYSHRSWRVEDGLPQSSVNAVAQTSDGYLWLATEEGLVRFDGMSFVVFDRSRVPDLASDSIVSLLTAESSEIWIGTRNGLTHAKGEHFLSFPQANGLPHRHVSALATDATGALWLGTPGGGLVRQWRGEFTQYTTRNGLSHDEVWAVIAARDGSIWIGTRAGLSRFKDGRFTIYTEAHGLSANWIYALAEDVDGAIWIGTSKGLDQFKDGRITSPAHFPADLNPSVRALAVDRHGALWIGTHGHGVFRRFDGKLSNYSSAEGLSDDQVTSLLEDMEGNLWIGTTGGGLNCLRDTAIRSYSQSRGIPKGSVWSMQEARDGAIWIGTERDGVIRFQDGRVDRYTTREGMLSNEINSLTEDLSGRIWVGTESGLNTIKDGIVVSIPTGQTAPVGQVRALYVSGDGSVWIGTMGNGVSRFNKGRFTSITKRDGLPDDWVRAILEERDGTMWFGTNHGLARWQAGRITVFGVSSGLEDDSICSLYLDPDGVLWVGTGGGGLARIENGTLRTITTRDGLFSNIIYAILEDGKGDFWMSCNRGIFRVSRQKLNQLAHGRLSRIDSIVYSISDGMTSRECNGGVQPAGWRGANGHLWFPTVAGAVEVDPSQAQEDPHPPGVLLERISINKESVDPLGSGITISPGRGDLQFEYTGVSLRAPERVRFRYRLVGYDSEWVDAGARRTALYTRVPPGQYTFEVIAANGGAWNTKAASFDFKLLPAFYQTGWFYAVCILGILGTAFATYRIRVRVHKKRAQQLALIVDERTSSLQREIEQRKRIQEALQNEVSERTQAQEEAQQARIFAEDASRVKSEFLASMSHELRTPLNAIIGYSELLEEDALESGETELLKDLTKIRTAGRHLLALVNDVLDLSKIEAGKMQLSPSTFDVRRMIDDVVVTVLPLIEKNGNSLVTSGLEENLGTITADPVKTRQVLCNLLGNAGKFTHDGQVQLSVSRTEVGESSRVCFTVKDTGIGMTREQMGRVFQVFTQADASTTRKYGGTGLGLTISRRFCRMMGGDITMESESGRGSEFVAWLPADTVPPEVSSDPGSAVSVAG